MFLQFLCLFLGGLGRALVGSGHLSRWSVYPLVAVVCASVGLVQFPLVQVENLLVLWAALVASLSMGMGYTQWESWKWMAVRFGLPSLVLVAPLLLLHHYHTSALYLLISLSAGLFYPHRQRAFEFLRLDRLNYSWIDSARLAEFVAGACILGGLGLL